MRQFLVLVLAFAVLSLGSCQKESSTPSTSGLEGTWKLTSRQCYCSPTPVPNERLVFNGQQVLFYKSGQVTRTGEYDLTTATSTCLGSSPPAPAIRFSYPPSNVGPTVVQYTLTGNTLTLDYGSPCDFPLDTYERLQ